MEVIEDSWYTFDGVEELDTPCLVVYPERATYNIELLKTMVSSPSLLRPHVKTHKSANATRLMMDQGLAKFKCATLSEAEMLGVCGAEDALLAYQPTMPKVRKFISLIKKYPKTLFSCLVDNIGTAKFLSESALSSNIVIGVFIDLNVGMDRTGIKPGMAFDLFMQLQPLPGIKVMGFHAYDGHIRARGIIERGAKCEVAYQPVERLRDRIQQAGYAYPLLIAGGSPTFVLHSKRKNVECSLGTFIFWDKGYYDAIPEQHFLWAALVVCRVVSLPDESKICIDLGYKSISSENELQNRVYFLNAPNLKPYSHSEEHMVIEAGKGHLYKIGDVLYALPIHICPTVAMFDKAITVGNNAVVSCWSINSRGRAFANPA